MKSGGSRETFVLNGRANVQLKVGTLCEWRFHKHESVGFDADYNVDNDGILEFQGVRTVYRHPERLKPGWTGSDEADAAFIFRVALPGTVKITFRRLFRFDPEGEEILTITVK